MVAIHVALLIGCVAEAVLLDRPFLPLLGWSMLALLLARTALRWWCIRTLGPQWNTRVVVVPGLPLVTSVPTAGCGTRTTSRSSPRASRCR
jgi:methyltransferase